MAARRVAPRFGLGLASHLRFNFGSKSMVSGRTLENVRGVFSISRGLLIAGIELKMITPTQREARAARAAAERLHKIYLDRAGRVLRIQKLYYQEFLSQYPLSALPIPPLVWGGRAEWERAYRTWRDAVLGALKAVESA